MFDKAYGLDKTLLGGKGAGLAEMASIGILNTSGVHDNYGGL